MAEWGTIKFEVPDFLEDIRQDINDVAEFLVAALDIVLTAMNLAKTFLIGFIDPISSLVQSIIDEIEGLLNDLRQLGFYITGDWWLIQDPGYPYEELRGGFSEYERRMIARLTDRTDPTRPDVSARTVVLSFFFYQSVDVSEIQRLIDFMLKLVQFFKMTFRPTNGLPVPSITDIRYGSDATSVFFPKTLVDFSTEPNVPNRVEVRWKITPPGRKNPYLPFTDLYMPGGFLVTVSTFPDGLPIVYDRPVANTDQNPSQANPSTNVQPHQYNVVRRAYDGKPLVLYGGAKMIQTSSSMGFNDSIDGGGNVKDGRTRVYGLQTPAKNAIVPLEELEHNGKPVFQQTYFVPIEVAGSQWVTGEYSIVLDLTDMPLDGDIKIEDNKMVLDVGDDDYATNLYVRVATCTNAIASGEKEYKYDFPNVAPQKDATSIPITVGLTDDTVGISDVGEFSTPREITFPDANTADYMKSLQAALVILALSRPDLMTVEQLEGTLTDEQLSLIVDDKLVLEGVALQPCGLENLKHLLGFLYDDYEKERLQKNQQPQTFRADLQRRIERTINDFFANSGPMPGVEKFIVENTELLRTITWGDIFSEVHPDQVNGLPSGIRQMTLWESLSSEPTQGGNPDYGVALNPYCSGLPEGTVADFFYFGDQIIRDRAPHFMEGLRAPPDSSYIIQSSATPEEAQQLLNIDSPGLRVFYEKFVQEDGSILIPEDESFAMEYYRESSFTEGSADDSPVFMVNRNVMEGYGFYTTPNNLGGMYFCRNLLYQYQNGVLFQQAAIALNVAASALSRSPEDGAWLNIRFFDTIPGMDDFLSTILNWMEQIKASIASIVDTILKYIEFIEARIVELQQLIRRINSLIQSILGLAFQIPQSSALTLVSNGTAGVVSDLVSADNKPSDSPLSYGAGLAIVIPGGPALALEIIQAFLDVTPGESPDPNATMSDGTTISDAVNAEQLPPPPPVPPDPPPDVL